MGRKGKQPRNKKGQYASYETRPPAGFGASAFASSKLGKLVILVDSDSEDVEAPLEVERTDVQIAEKSSKPFQFGKNPVKGKTTLAQYHVDNSVDMEISSASSDDVEALIDEVDEVFEEAQKKMCDDGAADPVKIKEGLEWLYEGLVGPSVALRSKRGKQAAKKKWGTKASNN